MSECFGSGCIACGLQFLVTDVACLIWNLCRDLYRWLWWVHSTKRAGHHSLFSYFMTLYQPLPC